MDKHVQRQLLVLSDAEEFERNVWSWGLKIYYLSLNFKFFWHSYKTQKKEQNK